MTIDMYKRFVYEEIAAMVGGLADPLRLELLELLAQCPRNVESLALLSGQGLSLVSHHLQILKKQRLVHSVRNGRRVIYSISSMALAIWNTISGIAAGELSEVRCATAELMQPGPDAESLEFDELVNRIAEGDAVVIDVRPAEEFSAGHLPGALSISLENLMDALPLLPKNKPVFAYCRGRYCVLSKQAVELLQQQGYEAARIPLGVAEWKAEGASLIQESATA